MKLVAFGDSITFGTWLNPATDPWPVHIHPGMPVVNRGVGGAALSLPNHAMPALASWVPVMARYEGASHVVLAAGMNDIISYYDMNPLTDAVCRIVDRLTGDGVAVTVCTVTPYRADQSSAEALDDRRLAYNAWLTGGFAPCHVVDWEHVLRPDGGRFMPSALAFDQIHPNAAGQLLLAAEFDRTWTP